MRSLCLIRETLARHDTLADFAFAMQGLGMGAVSLFGTPDQREWLEKTRAGRAISAFALTEPDSGSDVANTATTAERVDGGWRLTGEKTYISNGTIADFEKMQERFPGRALEKAVKGMLPKGPLGYAMIKKLKVYAEGSHPHAAQQPQPLEL